LLIYLYLIFPPDEPFKTDTAIRKYIKKMK